MIFKIPAASSFAPEVDLIFKCLLVISTILVFAVWWLIFYFSFKYRRGSKANREGGYKAKPWIEWSIAVLIFLFGLGTFIWSARTFYHMYLPPSDAITVNVIAKQWMWVFHDDKGNDQINRLKIPMGKPVRLIMTSEDVIHSFFVPAFRVKQDVLPGRYTSMWFTATETGTFEVLCSQYCGLSHSQMRAFVEVMTPEAYQEYIKENAGQGLPQVAQQSKGAMLYAKHSCSSCHDSTQAIGPSLKGIFGKKVTLASGASIVIDENYLRRAILTPQSEVATGFKPVMPTFQGRLSEGDLLSIINYLKIMR